MGAAEKMSEKPVILVVDDEPEIVEILRRDLEEMGFASLGANRPRDALKIVFSQKVHAVVTDMRMPGGGGVAIIDGMKTGGYDTIPVILVSGYTDYDPTELKKRGARALLSKPLDVKELKDALLHSIQNPKSSKKLIDEDDFKSIEIHVKLSANQMQTNPKPATIIEYTEDSLAFEVENSEFKKGSTVFFSVDSENADPEISVSLSGQVTETNPLSETASVVVIQLEGPDADLIQDIERIFETKQQQIVEFMSKARGM